MKASVCIGNDKWSIPYSDKDKVGDILNLAVVRYAKHAIKVAGRSEGTCCHFKTIDGAILDNDDLMVDVIDDNDVIIVVFGSTEDCENLNETESPASAVFSAGSTPRFQKVLPRLSHLQTPPLPPNLQLQQKFSTGPRQKSSSTKTPDRFRSQDEILASFSRLGARKSLGNSLSQDHWFEARHKLQNKQELETLEDVNNNNNKSSSQNSLKNDNRTESNVPPSNNNQTESANMFSPNNRSSSLLSLNQSTGASLPPSPQVSKIIGSRPKSAVIGYLTEFRGPEVTTRKLSVEETDRHDPDKQVPGDEGGVNLEAPIQNSSASSSSSSLKKKKNQSNTVLAPSNTRIIGKMMNIVLSKGVSGLGFTITSRDNMAELNSPIYIKNILPGGAAQLDGRLRVLDRLLAVNGVDVSEAKQTEATQLLRQIPVGSQVELLISRQVVEDTDDAMEGDGNGIQEVESENTKPDKSLSNVDEGHPDHFPRKSGVSEIGDRPKYGAYDLNSSRQPSMTKEMEKFLSSSLSPPYNSQETVPLRQLLPYGHCNLKPLVRDQKFVGMLIQASPSHPEFQLLEIDGKPLTSDMSKETCVKLVKVAIDKAWSKGGEKVVAKISRSTEFFKYQGIINGSKSNNVRNHPTAQMLSQPSAEAVWGMPPMPCSSKVHKIHEKDQEVSLPPSKSAPTTPMTAKSDRPLPGTEEASVTEENAERDDECQQGGPTFDRKGFGRQSMSEKRKGHADPRNLDFYRQMSSHKIKMLGDKNQDNDGGTSYATWDSRKAARMRKAANAMSTSKSEIMPSTNSEKQYKSMEELSANQEQPPKAAVVSDPSGSGMNDLDIRKEGQERTAAKPIENHDNGRHGVDDDQQGRADGRNVKKISRLRRDKKAITQEHKKLISYMKRTVENLRLSPQSDTPFDAAVTPPLKNHSDSQIASKYPYRAPLMSDGAIIDGYPVRATSPGSSQTPSPDKELNKSNPTSSLKFTFRSLPKKFSRSAWPFHISKIKGCDGGQEVSPEGIPTGRLQPEGKEEGLVNHSHLSQVDSRILSSNTPPSSSSSSSVHRHKTLAHVPVLRVEETSNIYKDIAQQRQQQEEELSWQQKQQQDSAQPQWFGISSRGPTGDWSHRPVQIHLRQQSQDLDRPSLDQYGGVHYTPQHHHNVFLPSSQQQCPQHVRHAQHQVYLSPQHQHRKFVDTDSNNHSYNCTTIIHRPQRSYDGFTQTPPAGRALTSVSLKMKPPEVQDTCGVPGHDSGSFSGSGGCYGIHSYSPEMQYRTYLSHNRGPKYVTTLRVNCDDDGGDSLSPNANDYDLHLVHPPKPPQNLHQDVAWTRSARV